MDYLGEAPPHSSNGAVYTRAATTFPALFQSTVIHITSSGSDSDLYSNIYSALLLYGSVLSSLRAAELFTVSFTHSYLKSIQKLSHLDENRDFLNRAYGAMCYSVENARPLSLLLAPLQVNGAPLSVRAFV